MYRPQFRGSVRHDIALITVGVLLQTELALANGQKFSLLNLALLGTDQYEHNFQQLFSKMKEMAVDISEYILLKFTMLLNSGTTCSRAHLIVAQKWITFICVVSFANWIKGKLVLISYLHNLSDCQMC